MAVFDNMNGTYSPGVAPSIIEYYERGLLKTFEANLVHTKDMQKRTLPAHNGSTVNFRRMVPFEPITEPLKEGVTPEGQTLSMTKMSATIKPYGRHVELTDEMDWKTLDNMHKEASDLLSRQAAESIDLVAANALNAGSNVIYVDKENGTNASRSAITSADILTHDAIKRTVRTLEKNKAKRFPDGYFHSIIDPETKYDLTSDPLFVDVAKYQDKSKVEKYELGTIYGVKFYESPMAKKFAAGEVLYGTATNYALASGSAATKKLTIAATAVGSDEGTQHNCARALAGKLVQIYDASESAYFPAIIDRVDVRNGALEIELRWLGSTTWAYAAGDKIYATGAGAGDYTVHSTVVYGVDAAGCVELEGNGKNVEIIPKPAGSSGALDPLNQRSTIAWKVRGFCATILQDAYIVRIEHGVTE